MPKFKLRHVIICEDVRREMNGKEILIGVYDDVVIAASIPAILDRMFFRIAIDCDPLYNDEYSFSIVGPDKKQIIQGSGKADAPPEGNANRIFGFAMRGFPAQEDGEYEVRFALGKTPKKIWGFTVRLPQVAKERERLAPGYT